MSESTHKYRVGDKVLLVGGRVVEILHLQTNNKYYVEFCQPVGKKEALRLAVTEDLIVCYADFNTGERVKVVNLLRQNELMKSTNYSKYFNQNDRTIGNVGYVLHNSVLKDGWVFVVADAKYTDHKRLQQLTSIYHVSELHPCKVISIQDRQHVDALHTWLSN